MPEPEVPREPPRLRARQALRYLGPDGPEIELPRGDVAEGVVRVGDTVRRPRSPHSDAVAAYLEHLQAQGFDGAPRYLGIDSQGRDVLSFLEGDVPGDPPHRWAADPELLISVGRLVARLHAVSSGFLAGQRFAAPTGTGWAVHAVPVAGLGPDPAPELIAHNDVTPQNVVVRDGTAVGLIDFDLAGPTTRLLDAYGAAMHWVPLRAPRDLWPEWADVDQPRRLRLFADGYGLNGEQRAQLVDLGIERAGVSWQRMRARALALGGGWARMWHEGVGDLILRRQAWLQERRTDLLAALLRD